MQNTYTETATVGAGCFWGVEEVFRKIPGVVKTSVGYSGGTHSNPTYRLVCTGVTGHAEAVQIEFDPEELPYANLLDIFWNTHDPTTLNRQGPDVGTQYRSVVFYHTENQRLVALSKKQEIQESGKYTSPIVTEIVPYQKFYRAEEYHQNYYCKR
jgi:peptide-methionine (S)-S-oxide reductase